MNIRRVSDISYAIEPQLPAKKYPLARALLVTCRHMEIDDIFGYDKLVAAEKATLQKGMNYRVGKITRYFDVVARAA